MKYLSYKNNQAWEMENLTLVMIALIFVGLVAIVSLVLGIYDYVTPGIPGPKGDTGPQGPAGPRGKAGTKSGGGGGDSYDSIQDALAQLFPNQTGYTLDFSSTPNPTMTIDCWNNEDLQGQTPPTSYPGLHQQLNFADPLEPGLSDGFPNVPYGSVFSICITGITTWPGEIEPYWDNGSPISVEGLTFTVNDVLCYGFKTPLGIAG
jgi:hypothetical protein